MKLGQPVFFRPAKAGEIAERFNEYLIKQGDKIVDRVHTYRGLGNEFFFVDNTKVTIFFEVYWNKICTKYTNMHQRKVQVYKVQYSS